MTRPELLGSRVVRAGLVVLLVVLAAVVVQVVRVHQSTGEFRLTPSEAPPELTEFTRLYRRSSSTPTHSMPNRTQQIGETPGGGDVFGPRHLTVHGPPAGPVVPTVIWVRDDSGEVWSYGLVGGP